MYHFREGWGRSIYYSLRECYILPCKRASLLVIQLLYIEDIVLDYGQDELKTFWSLAMFEDLISGNDVQIWGVTVWVGSKGRNQPSKGDQFNIFTPLKFVT